MLPLLCRFLQTMFLYVLGGLGITCGAHRLWSHRAYKANAPFRAFLMMLTSLANQGSVFHWVGHRRVTFDLPSCFSGLRLLIPSAG